MQLKPNTLLQGGKYRIVKELGSGGFGITYKAVQVSLNRYVAIKEFFMKDFCVRGSSSTQMSVGFEVSREQVDRYRRKFLKEARTIAQFKHPHIIRIHDVFEENGTAYYVVDYYNGDALNKYVECRGKLVETEALHYIRQIADALDFVHKMGFNHFNIKPENILLDENKNAVLNGFTVPEYYDETSTALIIPSAYVPHERYTRCVVSEFSPATDIYSLGAILYNLVTGKTPPEFSVLLEDGFPSFPSFVSNKVVQAITQAMQLRCKDRPQCVEAFIALLEDN